MLEHLHLILAKIHAKPAHQEDKYHSTENIALFRNQTTHYTRNYHLRILLANAVLAFKSIISPPPLKKSRAASISSLSMSPGEKHRRAGPDRVPQTSAKWIKGSA
jgi:hypothetical protein